MSLATRDYKIQYSRTGTRMWRPAPTQTNSETPAGAPGRVLFSYNMQWLLLLSADLCSKPDSYYRQQLETTTELRTNSPAIGRFDYMLQHRYYSYKVAIYYTYIIYGCRQTEWECYIDRLECSRQRDS